LMALDGSSELSGLVAPAARMLPQSLLGVSRCSTWRFHLAWADPTMLRMLVDLIDG
jgi:hypothetical protein